MMVVLIGLGDGGMVLGRQWASISISAMMAVFVCVCVDFVCCGEGLVLSYIVLGVVIVRLFRRGELS